MSSVCVKISGGDIKLGLRDNPIVLLLMVSSGLILMLLYIRIDSLRISKLSMDILEKSKVKEIDQLVLELTARQQEVFDLIISGKSNKEIMAELFIEQSTLKTHINHIYKKLKVISRNELKAKVK